MVGLAKGHTNNMHTILHKTSTVEKSDKIWRAKHVRKFDKQNFDELS